MAGHAQLKFVMTECSKTQIRLTGLSVTECSNVLRHFNGIGILKMSNTDKPLRKRLRIRSVISVNYHYITVLCPFNLLIRFKCYNTA